MFPGPVRKEGDGNEKPSKAELGRVKTQNASGKFIARSPHEPSHGSALRRQVQRPVQPCVHQLCRSAS
jgi:hypothetical protein